MRYKFIIKKNILIFILSAVLILNSNLTVCDSIENNDIELPNIYAVKDYVIYYVSQTDFRLYRMDAEDDNQKRICSDVIFTGGYLHSGIIMHKDYIYFINGTHGKNVYRIKNDGTDKKLICNNDVEDMFIYNDYLYCCTKSGSFKYEIDGAQKKLDGYDKKLCNIIFNSYKVIKDGSIKYCLTDDGIYDIAPDRKLSLIYKGNIFDFDVSKGNIYYLNGDDFCIYRLYKNKPVKLCNNPVIPDNMEDCMGGFKVAGDYIYYTNANDKLRLYRMKADGTSKKRLTDCQVVSFIADDDFIYYIDKYDDSSLTKLKSDGSAKQVLLKGDMLYVYSMEGDFLFFGLKWKEPVDLLLGRLCAITKDGMIYLNIQ